MSNSAKSKTESRREFFVRCQRANIYDDIGRDEGGDGIHWTVAQCQRWLDANTVNGMIDAVDGGAPFKCEIVHWA